MEGWNVPVLFHLLHQRDKTGSVYNLSTRLVVCRLIMFPDINESRFWLFVVCLQVYSCLQQYVVVATLYAAR